MLCVIMLSVIMLTAIKLSIILLNVVIAYCRGTLFEQIQFREISWNFLNNVKIAGLLKSAK